MFPLVFLLIAAVQYCWAIVPVLLLSGCCLFVVGSGSESDRVYLVDWGCCRTYKDLKGDMLTQGIDAGNDTFRSLHSHAQTREPTSVLRMCRHFDASSHLFLLASSFGISYLLYIKLALFVRLHYCCGC